MNEAAHNAHMLLAQESSSAGGGGGDVATSQQLCPATAADFSAVNHSNVISPCVDDDDGRPLDAADSAERGAVAAAAGPGPVCAGCQRAVVDRYYLAALGVAWHVGCLTCAHCARPLDSQLTCFVRDSAVYCRDDYYR